MHHHLTYFLAFGLGLLLAGCTRKADSGDTVREAGVHVAPVRKLLQDLRGTDVVAAVDGVPLTRATLEEIAKFQASVYAKSLKAPLADPRVAAFREGCMREGIFEFVLQQLLVNEAVRRGLVVPDESLARQAVAFSTLFDIPDTNAVYRAMAATAGITEQTLRRYVEENLLAQVVQNTLVVAPESLAPQEVSNQVSRLRTIIADCQASNQLQRAALAQARRQLEAGEDFAAVAERFSELNPQEGREWGSFTHEELKLHEHKGSAFADWAFEAPVGSVTPEPVQLDDGVALVKILNRTDGAREDSAVALKVQEVELARLTRRAFDPPVIPDAAALRAQMAAERTRQAQSDFNKSLFLHARIDYPNGTNLWHASVQE